MDTSWSSQNFVSFVSMDDAEGTDDSRCAIGRQIRRQQITDDRQGAITCATVRFDQRTRSGADARASNGIADQSVHRLFELAGRSDLDGSAVGEERFRDLTEVLHVRTEHDRLSVQGGFE